MKHIVNSLTVIMVILLGSCQKENFEPLQTPLPIYRQFNTEISTIILSEQENFDGFYDNLHIVNSIDELPDDRVFGTEEFRRADINFSKYSLIIAYNLILGDVLTCKYDWSRNNYFLDYAFDVTCERVKDSEFVDGEIQRVSYIRSAILVSHIPSDSRCVMGVDICDKD